MKFFGIEFLNHNDTLLGISVMNGKGHKDENDGLLLLPVNESEVDEESELFTMIKIGAVFFSIIIII